jgi:hypothetical protein
VNIAIKSGTNSLHGTLYDFVRNDVLRARNFFAELDPVTGRSKPQLRYNQFGASAGGPVRKDRAFFFFSYEGTRVRRNGSATARFPTPAMLDGNFAGELPIYDYQTGTPFANNQIPAERIFIVEPGATSPDTKADLRLSRVDFVIK